MFDGKDWNSIMSIYILLYYTMTVKRMVFPVSKTWNKLHNSQIRKSRVVDYKNILAVDVKKIYIYKTCGQNGK